MLFLIFRQQMDLIWRIVYYSSHWLTDLNNIEKGKRAQLNSDDFPNQLYCH